MSEGAQTMAEEKITLTRTELEQQIKQAVTEAKVDQLYKAFSDHEIKEDSYLKDIFDKIRMVQEAMGGWPIKLSQCSDTLEQDIKDYVKENFMSKPDAELLKQSFSNELRSIKLWIVSTVGGFTSAGLLIAWAFKLFGG